MVIKMYGEIEIKNKKNLTKRIIDAINNRENVIYNNRYIINVIGSTIYIDLQFLKQLSIEEIEEILQKTIWWENENSKKIT